MIIRGGFPNSYFTSPIVRKEIMKCRKCDIRITKKNCKKVTGGWSYATICKGCHNKDVKARYEKKKKILKESRWF